MFIVRVPLLPILKEVVSYCRLPYVAVVHEVSGDGVDLVGVELELPLLFDGDVSRRHFFWTVRAAPALDSVEPAAFQALQFLQSIYRFSVADFNSYHLALCTQARSRHCRLPTVVRAWRA